MLKRKIFLIQVILFLLIISTREQLSVDEQTQVNKYHTCEIQLLLEWQKLLNC